jgi:hypothetical protein
MSAIDITNVEKDKETLTIFYKVCSDWFGLTQNILFIKKIKNCWQNGEGKRQQIIFEGKTAT